jgi:hypothetical protein
MEEGGEGLQSRPTSPAPITQAEKTFFFIFFFGASLLKTQQSPGFGHEKRIIFVGQKETNIWPSIRATN